MTDFFFCPLYSGSSGNALFCQYGKTRLLIDAGKSGKCIADALRSIGAEMDTIDGVLITHEHSDHISGVGVLARKYHLPLYATPGTWRAMEDKIGSVASELRHEIHADREFYLGDIGVAPFAIPHDAADPVGFRLYGGHVSVSTATDLGFFPDSVFERVAGSSMILLESNHDPDLLRRNPHYSPPLKQRILGNRGHLSNEACAEALLRLIRAGTREFILGHLSGENNSPTLARNVSTRALVQVGIEPETEVRLRVALRDQVGALYRIHGIEIQEDRT